MSIVWGRGCPQVSNYFEQFSGGEPPDISSGGEYPKSGGCTVPCDLFHDACDVSIPVGQTQLLRAVTIKF